MKRAMAPAQWSSCLGHAAWRQRVSRFAARKFREVTLDEWQSILDEAGDQGKSQSTIKNAAMDISGFALKIS